MNLSKSNKIINLLTTIQEAITEITNTEKNVSLQILADCQDAIFAINDLLLGIDNKKIFEKTGELIKQIFYVYESLENCSHYNIDFLSIDNLLEKIEELKCCVINNTRKTYEIVFLPYKASMWDCFDSIYREAIKEPMCHVTVLPVPYNTLDNNGKVVDLVYEGNQLPKEVEITDYQKYDISESNPDVVFIHNPYDGFNKVTRLLEKYYSGELAKHTQHLVYIPYFVVDGNRIADHFCKLPAVKNAWKTIVQSKEVRNAYLRFISPDKVAALGSPKYDMVVAQDISNIIPAEWKEKTNERRVFLYNTNLSSILDESISLIDRIKNVIDVFRNRRNVVLLWRPHPLSMETARTFQSKYYEKYIALVNEFCLMENGIYDDSSDIARAILISDAYIGDESSSVVAVYKATQKPMLLLSNNGVDSKTLLKHLSATAATIYDDELWLFYNDFCSIFTVNLLSGETKLFASIQDENNGRYPLFTQMVVHNEKLYMIPFSSNRIGVINLVTREIHYITIDKDRDNGYSVVLSDNKIFLFPVYYSLEIICIDTNTEKVKKYNYPLQSILPAEMTDNIPIFKGICLIDNQVWQALTIAPFIVSYDLKQNKFNIYEIKSDNKSFRGLAFDGKDFWLLPQHGKTIIRFNKHSNQIMQQIMLPDWFQWQGTGTFIDPVFYEGSVWLIPYLSDKIIKINVATGEVKGIDYRIQGYQLDYEGANSFLRYEVIKSKLYLYPDKSNMLIWIDMLTEEIGGHELLFPTDLDTGGKLKLVHDCAANNRYSHQEIYRESICSVEDFIGIINGNKTWKQTPTKNSVTDGNNGKRIWKYIKDNLEGVHYEMEA